MYSQRILGLLFAWIVSFITLPLLPGQGSNAQSSSRREVPLAAANMSYVQAALQQLFQGRVYADASNGSRLLLQLHAGSVSIEFLHAEQKLRLEGGQALTQDIATLITAVSKQSPDSTVRILPLNDQGQDSLSNFQLRASRGMHGSENGKFGLASFAGLRRTQLASSAQEPKNDPASANNNQPGFQLPPNAPSPLQPPSGPTTPDQKKDGGGQTLPLPQFEGVQIEMLPELDAIILRGRDQQLSDLAEIIKRLDEASKLSKPEIEVIPLSHASSESLGKLVTNLQEKLIGARQGRVTVTPLVKPNALLLIGWGEALESTKQLILKLDQPTPANAQFEVIPLKHAIATDVQTQLTGLFKSKEGLAPLIQASADSRINAIIVQASPRDMAEIKLLIDQLDVPMGSMIQHAKIFTMKYSIAADVAKSLQQALTPPTRGPNASIQLLDRDGKPLVTSGILGASQITVNDRNNTIVVSASPENLILIEKLIEQMDTPGAIAKIKIFPVKNGDAASMVDTLRSLLPTPAAGSQSTTQLSSSPDETALLPLRFTVDARGNNIIAVGSEGDLKIVEALIFRLDESDKMQRKSTVYQLKNAPAVDVALAINEFLRSKRQVEIAAPGANNPFEQLEKEVVVVPEPVQNKLILSATPRYYGEISQLIEQLDQQPPQVMIQVMIAEITLGNTDEFGVEWGLQDSVLFDRSLLGGLVTRPVTRQTSTPAGVVTENTQEILAGTNTPGFNFNSTEPLGNSGAPLSLTNSNRVGGQGLSNFSVGRLNNELGFGGLVLSASSENVSFLLRALQESRRLEVLSRPQVLTLDNQQAFIQVGQRVPRIVSSVVNQNFAQNSVLLENVGLIIGVTPRISPEGNVVMEIDAEKSKLGPESEGIPISVSNNGNVIRAPRIDTITAQATVSAADGETILLGGLISRSTRTEHRQVPWLGSLPLLKYLFSYDSNSFLRTELLIIMTPHVIRSPGDMERLKQAEFARMSWCEADVFDLHGDVYPSNSMASEAIKQDNWNTVYPDVDPRGASLKKNQANPSVGAPAFNDPANTVGTSAPFNASPSPNSASGNMVAPAAYQIGNVPNNAQGNVPSTYMQANQAIYTPPTSPTSPATYVIPTSPTPPVHGGFPR